MADVKTHSTLPTNLVAYWELEETSGTRVDVVGTGCGGSGCDMTDNNTVGSGTGKQGTAADFEFDNSEFLSHTDHADLSITGAFSASMWVNFESLTVTKAFISKWNETGNQRTWGIDIQSDQPRLLISEDGTNSPLATVQSGTALTTGSFFHIVVTYEPSTEIAIWVNGSSDVNTTSIPAAIKDSTADFEIGGSRVFAGGPVYTDGLMDEVALWDKLLTDSEISDLYNGGAGLPYAGPQIKTRNTVAIANIKTANTVA